MWQCPIDSAQNYVVTEYKGVVQKAGKQKMPSLEEIANLALFASV